MNNLFVSDERTISIKPEFAFECQTPVLQFTPSWSYPVPHTMLQFQTPECYDGKLAQNHTNFGMDTYQEEIQPVESSSATLEQNVIIESQSMRNFRAASQHAYLFFKSLGFSHKESLVSVFKALAPQQENSSNDPAKAFELAIQSGLEPEEAKQSVYLKAEIDKLPYDNNTDSTSKIIDALTDRLINACTTKRDISMELEQSTNKVHYVDRIKRRKHRELQEASTNAKNMHLDKRFKLS